MKKCLLCCTIINILLVFTALPITVEIKKFWKHPKEPTYHSGHLKTNYPFITGDEFRNICDVIFDETNTKFNTENVKHGSLVFVKNLQEFLDCFFEKIHPHIKSKYILISHNGICHKNKEEYKKHLDNENIVAWFGKNLTIKHDKCHPIPLGIANRYFRDSKVHEKIMAKLPMQKDFLLYMNFSVVTNKQERSPVKDIFSSKHFCYNPERKGFEPHLNDVSRSKFVLSPAGSGIDCHRTWESLMVGTFPIVKSSGIDCLFEDLPVIIIKDWNKITKEFLSEKYDKILSKQLNNKYNFEKLYIDYWVNKIKEAKSILIQAFPN